MMPAALLALAVLYSRFSGNDKAPILILFVLVLDAVFVLAFVVRGIVGNGSGAWRCAGFAALPLLYAGIVLALARHSLVDSAVLLGIR